MQAIREPYRAIGQPDHLGGEQAVALEVPGEQTGARSAEIHGREEVRRRHGRTSAITETSGRWTPPVSASPARAAADRPLRPCLLGVPATGISRDRVRVDAHFFTQLSQ